MSDRVYVYIIDYRQPGHGWWFYTGITNDPLRRFDEHCNGKGARCLHGKDVGRMAVVEWHGSRGKAMRREREIKNLSHREKASMHACAPYFLQRWIKREPR
jgi:putative endonuclease